MSDKNATLHLKTCPAKKGTNIPATGCNRLQQAATGCNRSNSNTFMHEAGCCLSSSVNSSMEPSCQIEAATAVVDGGSTHGGAVHQEKDAASIEVLHTRTSYTSTYSRSSSSLSQPLLQTPQTSAPEQAASGLQLCTRTKYQNFCDAILHVAEGNGDDEVFQCHKIKLVEKCQYFKKIFIKCSNKKQFHMPEYCRYAAMKEVIRYLYQSECFPTDDIIDQVLMLGRSDRLGIPELQDYVLAHMVDNIDDSNAVLYLEACTENGIDNTFAYTYIADNFHKTENKSKISFENLQRLLLDDALHAENEYQVFWSVFDWISHNECHDESLQQLVGSVRYGAMSREHRVSIADYFRGINTHSKLKDYVFRYLQRDGGLKHRCTGKLTHARLPRCTSKLQIALFKVRQQIRNPPRVVKEAVRVLAAVLIIYIWTSVIPYAGGTLIDQPSYLKTSLLPPLLILVLDDPLSYLINTNNTTSVTEQSLNGSRFEQFFSLANNNTEMQPHLNISNNVFSQSTIDILHAEEAGTPSAEEEQSFNIDDASKDWKYCENEQGNITTSWKACVEEQLILKASHEECWKSMATTKNELHTFHIRSKEMERNRQCLQKRLSLMRAQDILRLTQINELREELKNSKQKKVDNAERYSREMDHHQRRYNSLYWGAVGITAAAVVAWVPHLYAAFSGPG